MFTLTSLVTLKHVGVHLKSLKLHPSGHPAAGPSAAVPTHRHRSRPGKLEVLSSWDLKVGLRRANTRLEQV
jgi:hypothetical protein